MVNVNNIREEEDLGEKYYTWDKIFEQKFEF